MPKVSIIMPVYNSEKYVADAINSLLDQTFTDFEIIVINDGSRDNSATVVGGFQDERIVFIDNKDNHGFLATLNRCIELAKGTYIARLDDDDIACPDRIEKQVDYMDSHPSTVLCGSFYEFIINEYNQDRAPDMPPIFTDEQFKFSLAFGNYCISHSSFMMRRDTLERYHIRYETYLQVPDYHMQTCMSEVGAVHFIRERLIEYRIHASQSTAIRSQKMQTGEIDRARLWYIHRLPLSDREKRILSKGVLRKLTRKRDYLDFADTVKKYAGQCGMKETKEDRECIAFVLDSVFRQQKRSIGMLLAYNHRKIRDFHIRRLGLIYSIMCIIGYNPIYISSDYEECDDGTEDKHNCD